MRRSDLIKHPNKLEKVTSRRELTMMKSMFKTAMVSDSWCQCEQGRSSRLLTCLCGEQENAKVEWGWDVGKKSSSVVFLQNNRDVVFHPKFSSGTAAVAGNTALAVGCHHYWEIRMLTPVYGTDVMVGLGTEKANLTSNATTFASLLGKCEESWGYSYKGFIHHAGKFRKYSTKWGQGAILGVHFDAWRGTLEFYINRKPLGIAFRGLKNKAVYPMLSSTAAKSGMRLICAQSFPNSLQFSCLKLLAHTITARSNLLNDVKLPPGLQAFIHNNYYFLVGQQVEEEIDFMDTPPLSSESRPPARPTTEINTLPSNDMRKAIFNFVHDDSVPTITEINAQKRTCHKRRKRFPKTFAENIKIEDAVEDSDEECFLRFHDASRNLQNHAKASLESRLRPFVPTSPKLESVDNGTKVKDIVEPRDTATTRDTGAADTARRANETYANKAIKKRFTLKKKNDKR